MKKLPALMLAAAMMIMSGCNGNNNQSAQTMSNISEETVGRTVQAIVRGKMSSGGQGAGAEGRGPGSSAVESRGRH